MSKNELNRRKTAIKNFQYLFCSSYMWGSPQNALPSTEREDKVREAGLSWFFWLWLPLMEGPVLSLEQAAQGSVGVIVSGSIQKPVDMALEDVF